jgi:hypothetical protein
VELGTVKDVEFLNRRGIEPTVADALLKGGCQTEIRLSNLSDCRKKSNRFNAFPIRATWLLLAPEAAVVASQGQ